MDKLVGKIEKELQPMTFDEVVERLREFETFDVREMMSNGKLDFGKVRVNGLTKFIKSITVGEDGGLISFEIYNTSKAGYVYLIRAEGSDSIKIGRTTNIDDRLASLETSSPFSLTLVHHKWVENSYQLEAMLHSEFSERRIKREWFSLSDEEVKRAYEIIETYTYEFKPDFGSW